MRGRRSAAATRATPWAAAGASRPPPARGRSTQARPEGSRICERLTQAVGADERYASVRAGASGADRMECFHIGKRPERLPFARGQRDPKSVIGAREGAEDTPPARSHPRCRRLAGERQSPPRHRPRCDSASAHLAVVRRPEASRRRRYSAPGASLIHPEIGPRCRSDPARNPRPSPREARLESRYCTSAPYVHPLPRQLRPRRTTDTADRPLRTGGR